MVTDVNIQPGATVIEVVTLAKAKKHLKLESSFVEEDDLIQTYIDAAVEMAQNYTGMYIKQYEVTLKLNSLDNPFVFEAYPLLQIDEVKYFLQGDDVLQTMDSSNYNLTAETSKRYAIRFTEVPNLQDRFDAVQIKFTAGMTTTEVSASKVIQQAVLLMVADMYERREDRVEVLSTQAMSLLRVFKKF